jgi:hypothetical protein
MKKILIFLLFLVYGHKQLKAQKDLPKYLRENDKSFREMTARTTTNGWIEFKKLFELIKKGRKGAILVDATQKI